MPKGWGNTEKCRESIASDETIMEEASKHDRLEYDKNNDDNDKSEEESKEESKENKSKLKS